MRPTLPETDPGRIKRCWLIIAYDAGDWTGNLLATLRPFGAHSGRGKRHGLQAGLSAFHMGP